MALLVLTLVATCSVASGQRITVAAGAVHDLGHGVSIDNSAGTGPVTVDVNPDCYFDPVSGDPVWILNIRCIAGHVIIDDDNDTYTGPPGFQNDTAVWITDTRDPPDSEYVGGGTTHGNGDTVTTLPNGELKGLNRKNGVVIPGCTPG